MSKGIRKTATDKQTQLRWTGRLILAFISFIGLYVIYKMFDGVSDVNIFFLLITMCGALVVGFLFIRKSYMHRNLSTQEYWLLAFWFLLVAILYIWLQMTSDSFSSDTEYYIGVGVLLAAVFAYSLAFASLWGKGNVELRQKNKSWQETLIDRPYFRPSISLALTAVSFLTLLYHPGVPEDIFAVDYQQMAQIVGLINLVVAVIAVVLSIIAIFKVRSWFKLLFAVSTLIGLWVIAFQILGIALSGGIY